MSQALNLYINDVSLPKKSLFESEIQEAVDTLMQGLSKTYASSRLITKQYKLGCALIVEGLYQTYCTFSKDARLCVSQSPSGYKKNDVLKINRIGYRPMKEVIYILEQLGWIYKNTGYISGSGKNVPTKLMPIGRLLAAFEKRGICWQELKPSSDHEIIILKNYNSKTKEKKIIPTPDTRQVRLMRKNLAKINKFIGQHAICLHRTNENLRALAVKMSLETYQSEWFSGKPIKSPRMFNFSQTSMRRVFARSDMQKGGRFYGAWWQFIPREERQYITIDGLGTIEIDFSEIHPRLLYLEMGLTPPAGDLYDLNIRFNGMPYDSAKEPYRSIRMVIKKYFNVLINDENGNYKLPRSDQQIIGMTTAQLHSLILQKHPQLRASLAVGKGLIFQYIDSQIAEKVMLSMLKKNIVCLPIHDSFICCIHNAKDLHQAMITAYKDILNTIPKIKQGARYKSDFQICFKPNGEVDREKTINQHQDSIHNDYFKSWRIAIG